MSQAKVNKYKNEKANRKKTNARNKVKRVIARTVSYTHLDVYKRQGYDSAAEYTQTLSLMKKQLNRMVEVIKVIDLTDVPLHMKEILYVRVSKLTRDEITDRCV